MTRQYWPIGQFGRCSIINPILSVLRKHLVIGQFSFTLFFHRSLTQHTGSTFMGNGLKRALLPDRKRLCGPCIAAIAGLVFSTQNREQYSTFDPIVMEQLRSDPTVDYGPRSYGINYMADPTNISLALESQVRRLNKCL